jgi:hypothetical protein
MTNTVLIKNIEALVDLDAEPGYMKHGYVLIEDGIIRLWTPDRRHARR